MALRMITVVLGLLLFACDGTGQVPSSPEGPMTEGGDPSTKGPIPQGVRGQGTRLDGTKLEAMQAAGKRLRGIRLDSVTLSGGPVQGVQLFGTSFAGAASGRKLSGKDFIGASLTATDDGGAAVALMISQIEADPTDTMGEVLLYTVLYRDPATGAFDNACEPDADGVQKAIPVGGVWDGKGARSGSATDFTFGCVSGVIAKCVRWGYRPWKTFMGTSLGETHQTCTRMARADYCGDGMSHTVDGTLIDAYDPLGLLVETRNDGMFFEAHWNTDGAYCVSRERWLNLDPASPDKVLGNVLLLECRARIHLPGAAELLGDKPCFMDLGTQPRSSIRTSNNSRLLQVAAAAALR